MRALRNKVRCGLFFDAVLLVVLLCLLIAFIQRRGHTSLPEIHISFRSVDKYNDDEHQDKSRYSIGGDDRKPPKSLSDSDDDDDGQTGNGRRTDIDKKDNEITPSQWKADSRLQQLPDVRPLKCRELKYDEEKLKSSATVIVQFTDYEFYDAQVTISSVLVNADDVLAEIIVIDAASTVEHVRNDAKKYVKSLRTKAGQPGRGLTPVRLISADSGKRGDNAGGNIHRWPRVIGAKQAQTVVVVFLDPGAVVGRGWLAPLVNPLVTDDQDKRPSAVEAHLDRLRNKVKFDYHKTEDDLIPVPSWSLSIKMRRFPVEKKNDDAIYRSIPVLRGSAFAVRVSELKGIGGLFDDAMDAEGGGELLELSLRLWMCGNGIEQATCSRVGVSDIDEEIRIVSPTNAHHVTNNWVAAYKTSVQRFGGHSDDESGQQRPSAAIAAIRDKCKDFEWYIKTATLGSLPTPMAPDSIQFGLLEVQTGRCAQISDDRRTDLVDCQYDRIPSKNSMFELTIDNRLISSSSGRCMTVTSSYYVIEDDCRQPVTAQQKWQFNGDGELICDWSNLCATHVTDPDKKFDGRQIMMAQNCQRDNEKVQQFKRWRFITP